MIDFVKAKRHYIMALAIMFVVVSLRKPMLDNADRMIGVTQKDKGVTKISGVKLRDE